MCDLNFVLELFCEENNLNNNKSLNPPQNNSKTQSTIKNNEDISEESGLSAQAAGFFRLFFQKENNILGETKITQFSISLVWLISLIITLGALTLVFNRSLSSNKSNIPKEEQSPTNSISAIPLETINSQKSIDHYVAIDYSLSASDVDNIGFQQLKEQFCTSLNQYYRAGDRQIFYKFAASQQFVDSREINSGSIQDKNSLCQFILSSVSSSSDSEVGTSLINLLGFLYKEISKEKLNGNNSPKIITVIIHEEEPAGNLLNSQNEKDLELLISIFKKLQSKNTNVVIVSSEKSLVENLTDSLITKIEKSQISELDNVQVCRDLNIRKCIKNGFGMARQSSAIQ